MWYNTFWTVNELLIGASMPCIVFRRKNSATQESTENDPDSEGGPNTGRKET